MFDFNCDVAQEYGVHKNEQELEVANYVSSVNVASGFSGGDPLSIKRALEFAQSHELAVGALVGYQDIAGFGCRETNLSDEEIEALVIYQIGAVAAFAKALGLEIEQVRACGAMYEAVNTDIELAKSVARAVKKFDPWLTLIVGNYETKKVIEDETGIKCAYEVMFTPKSSIRELREMSNKPDTVHFNTVEDAKRAWDVIKPTPVSFNRVKAEIV